MSKIVAEHKVTGNKCLKLVQGDITEERVDAIVNAANSGLIHGGGVAGAISHRGGSSIQKESQKVAPVPVGEAVVTGGGSLPCRYVIHAVGPRYGEGEEELKLANAVNNSLLRAEELKLKTISLPAISSGIFGFPKDQCAEVLVSEARAYLESQEESSLEEIRFCIIDEPTMVHFKREFEQPA